MSIHAQLSRMTAPHGAASVQLSEDAGVPKDHLVWSMEHDAWWGPDHCGYREHVLHAGLYTQAEAEEIVRGSTYGEHVREKAVPLSEVERDYFRPMAPGTFGASLKLGSAVSPVPAPTPEAVQKAVAWLELECTRAEQETPPQYRDDAYHVGVAWARQVRKLLGYLATPQPPREGEGRLAWIERIIDRDGGIILQRWDHDGRRFVGKNAEGWACLLVHKFARRGGADETLNEAIDAAIAATPEGRADA